MDPIRILIADDHPLFRDGLRALLESVPDMQVIGEAMTGNEVVVQTTSLQPDVILSMFEDDASVFAAVRAGARGYLLKGAVQEETLRAIRAVSNGEAIFGPAVAERLMHYFGSTRPTAKSGPAQFFPELTEREYEILTLIAQRKSNAEIATHFVLSPKTVRNHVSNILSKLQVADRTEAMHAAWTAGLGQGDGERTHVDK